MKTVRMMGAMTFAAWTAIPLSGCVCAPKYSAERGSIIVDSPFDLEIGSTEYAQSFGDLSIDISYATPRYAKKGNAFEIVRKGAIVVNIVQSPLITTGKVKGALRPF